MRAWVFLVVVVVVGVWGAASAQVSQGHTQPTTKPKKRQIYREAVLPAQGGVIPEGAFTRQRLRHNANDQLGVEAPDGFLYITRSVDNRYGIVDPEDRREILHLLPHDRNNLTHPNGIFNPRPLPTTYLLRRPTLGRVFVPDRPRFRDTITTSTDYARVAPWSLYQAPPSFFFTQQPVVYH